MIFKNGNPVSEQQYDIVNIAVSPTGDSIMAQTRDIDGSQYIMKNGAKIEKIGSGYIE